MRERPGIRSVKKNLMNNTLAAAISNGNNSGIDDSSSREAINSTEYIDEILSNPYNIVSRASVERSIHFFKVLKNFLSILFLTIILLILLTSSSWDLYISKRSSLLGILVSAIIMSFFYIAILQIYHFDGFEVII